jgi:hypothetical protein
MPNTDLVLASIPYTETSVPLMAIAVLKSIAEKANWDCVSLDFNIQYYNATKNHLYQNKLIDWFFNETYYPEIEDTIYKMFNKMADDILSYKPKLIGLSLFSYACQVSCKYLCILLKQKSPDTKIVIGGSGVFDNVLGDHSYVGNLKDMNLIDHYIIGDAENSFYDFLMDKKTVGVDGSDWKELNNSDLEVLPIPNYDDYDFSQYELPAIPIVGSRGCVRRCTFCNDIVHWKKFSYRGGEHIFNEMITQYQRYGLREFVFSDALINGNMREFKIFLQHLAKHNEDNPNEKLSWNSQFIFRPKNQFNEEDWKLLKLSNPTILKVGIESLSEHVRFHMGKKFDQASLIFGLEQALKHNIQILGLMIVGYPTESRDDIEIAKKFMTDHTHFKDIITFSWGGTMAILPGTAIYQNPNKYDIQIFGPPWQNWINVKTGSNPKQRAEWLMELHDYCDNLGYKTISGVENEGIVEILLHQEADYGKHSNIKS